MIFKRSLGFAFAALLASQSAPALAQEPAPQPTIDVEQAVPGISRLIEVWGFVKYHHPDAQAGRLAMDQAFFALYPKIAQARSVKEADHILVAWLDSIGIGAPCDPCGYETMPDEDSIAIIQPTNGWIANLPEPLALRVKAIFENRPAASATFHIEPNRNTGNAVHLNEADYTATGRDDAELRMLATARIWNTLRYWFPYRDVMDADVASILEPAAADTLRARSRAEHKRAITRLVVKSDDGHGNILAYRNAVRPSGQCSLPYSWRMVDGTLIVDGLQAHPDGKLQRGDVIRAINGESIADLDKKYSPMISASNEAYRDSVLAFWLSMGECGAHSLSLERGGATVDVTVDWLSEKEARLDRTLGRNRKGATIQSLDNGVTYVRFSQLKKEDMPALLETANAGSGVVIDMRGYMRDYLIYHLGPLLVDQPVEFARFTQPSISTPGLFMWGAAASIAPDPEGRRITVPVVALIDESAASSPEYHAMAWRAAGVTMIGSATAGADGNVSTQPLPRDGAGMRYSGIGVFYPDRSPTQRIGIQPDIEVKPTIAGITAGRDEVLERALEVLRSRQDEQIASP